MMFSCLVVDISYYNFVWILASYAVDTFGDTDTLKYSTAHVLA